MKRWRPPGRPSSRTRPFSTLSGGEKQRVIIAAALAQISRGATGGRWLGILLLDEPTAALDLEVPAGVARCCAITPPRARMTIVVSTHDLKFAARLCRTLVMLKDGRVLSSGPTETC